MCLCIGDKAGHPLAEQACRQRTAGRAGMRFRGTVHAWALLGSGESCGSATPSPWPLMGHPPATATPSCKEHAQPGAAHRLKHAHDPSFADGGRGATCPGVTPVSIAASSRPQDVAEVAGSPAMSKSEFADPLCMAALSTYHNRARWAGRGECVRKGEGARVLGGCGDAEQAGAGPEKCPGHAHLPPLPYPLPNNHRATLHAAHAAHMWLGSTCEVLCSTRVCLTPERTPQHVRLVHGGPAAAAACAPALKATWAMRSTFGEEGV